VFGVFDSGLRVYGFVQDSRFLLFFRLRTIGLWTFIGEFWNLSGLCKKYIYLKLPNCNFQPNEVSCCFLGPPTSFHLLDFLFLQLDYTSYNISDNHRLLAGRNFRTDPDALGICSFVLHAGSNLNFKLQIATKVNPLLADSHFRCCACLSEQYITPDHPSFDSCASAAHCAIIHLVPSIPSHLREPCIRNLPSRPRRRHLHSAP
jgi:hypothetical protein